jgi:hypothetical protein
VVKVKAVEDATALEVRLAIVEGCGVEGSSIAEKCFVDFRTKLAGDLAPLHEAYEHNIQSLGSIL